VSLRLQTLEHFCFTFPFHPLERIKSQDEFVGFSQSTAIFLLKFFNTLARFFNAYR
jgi:hypothetical protein